MSNLRTAAQQALNALKCLVEAYEMQNMIRADINDAEYAITALRAALEQPEHGVTLKPVFYAPRRLSNEEVLAVIGPPCATQDCMPSKCSLAAQNTELDRVLVEMEHALVEADAIMEEVSEETADAWRKRWGYLWGRKV
jgi:hypothetical protein